MPHPPFNVVDEEQPQEEASEIRVAAYAVEEDPCYGPIELDEVQLCRMAGRTTGQYYGIEFSLPLGEASRSAKISPETSGVTPSMT